MTPSHGPDRPLAVAVLGATGAVGREMIRLLEERRFPVRHLVPLASERSAGREVVFRGEAVPVRAVEEEAFEGVELALFSAGAGVSRQWAERAVARGALVIDNSSAWRMHEDVPLVVPEVNMEAAREAPRGIVANPNCSTIQLVVAIAPIHREARIRRVVVATYQAVSGAGARAVEAFREQRRAVAAGAPVEPGPLGGTLAGNLLMHWAVDEATGYQEEELKMVFETRKILGAPELRVSPTAVRVPVESGHSEALTLELERPMTAARARALLEAAPGVEVLDDLAAGAYPQPLAAAGKDPVYVGRIREDLGNPGGLQLWVVADNLRKGAALNAVQIAERLLSER